MLLEPIASCLCDGIEKCEVVLRGYDRGMPHVDRERRESYLNIDACAVPAKHCMDRERKAQVVSSWRAPGGSADTGFEKELVE